jgi:hypothetical protein
VSQNDLRLYQVYIRLAFAAKGISVRQREKIPAKHLQELRDYVASTLELLDEEIALAKAEETDGS